MTTVRIRTCAAGGALAVGAGLLADQGSILGADLPHTALLGAALGAVLGLVPDRTVLGRIGGFLAGFAAAWIGYALRAGVFPDIPMGRALAAVIVVGLVTGVAVASNGRLPLWSGLVGAGALLGAYEATFVATPTTFLSDSMTAVTTVVVAAAFGLLIASSVEELLRERPAPDKQQSMGEAMGVGSVPTPRSAVDADASKEVQA